MSLGYTAAEFGTFPGADGPEPRRHILDKEIVAMCLKIGGIHLSSAEFTALKRVVNDTSINMHGYRSKGANVGHSPTFAADHDCNKRIISDKSAVRKVIEDGFGKGMRVELTSHENAHIDKQSDILLHPAFKAALTEDNYHRLIASYEVLTNNVYGPKESGTYTSGKAVDARKFRFVPPKIKQESRDNATKYLERLSDEKSALLAKATAATSVGVRERDKTARSAQPRTSTLAAIRGPDAGVHAYLDPDDLSSLLHKLSVTDAPPSSAHYGPPTTLPIPVRVIKPVSTYKDTATYNTYPTLIPTYGGTGSGIPYSGGVSGTSYSGGVGSGTRATSQWDTFRSEVWTGGTRAEMSSAYKDWKASL